mgnify:CR=1 FL=1
MAVKKSQLYSSLWASCDKLRGGKAAIETAEKLMDLYSFHHKFQTKEYIDKCNQVWSDE